MSQTAVIHLSRGIGLSSKIVPTLIENCFFGCLVLHSHRRRVAIKRKSLDWQVGQIGPSGKMRALRNWKHRSGLAKYAIACWRVLGSVAMTKPYQNSLTVSSILLPRILHSALPVWVAGRQFEIIRIGN